MDFALDGISLSQVSRVSLLDLISLQHECGQRRHCFLPDYIPCGVFDRRVFETLTNTAEACETSEECMKLEKNVGICQGL
jgi:hypothetical protein